MNQRATPSLKRSAAAFLVLALAAAPAALAIPRGAGGTGGTGAGPRQPTASQGARKVVDDAMAQLKYANELKSRARMRVELAMKSSRPEWQAAQKEHDKADADLKAAIRAVELKLRTNPEYKAASTAWTTADTKYRALEQDAKANQAEMESLHQQRLAQVLVKRKLEQEAMENDPKVIDCKARLAEAKTKLDSYKTEVDAVARSDPEYMTAEQQVLAAEQQVLAARQGLAQAAKSDREAAAAASKAKAEEAKAKSKSGSGSGKTGY
jgi:hypothetical protein